MQRYLLKVKRSKKTNYLQFNLYKLYFIHKVFYDSKPITSFSTLRDFYDYCYHNNIKYNQVKLYSDSFNDFLVLISDELHY